MISASSSVGPLPTLIPPKFCVPCNTVKLNEVIYLKIYYKSILSDCERRLFYLTRCFRHKYCLLITRVFTINIQGTHAKAITTKRDCMAIYKKRWKVSTREKNKDSYMDLFIHDKKKVASMLISPVLCRIVYYWGHCN